MYLTSVSERPSLFKLLTHVRRSRRLSSSKLLAVFKRSASANGARTKSVLALSPPPPPLLPHPQLLPPHLPLVTKPTRRKMTHGWSLFPPGFSLRFSSPKDTHPRTSSSAASMSSRPDCAPSPPLWLVAPAPADCLKLELRWTASARTRRPARRSISLTSSRRSRGRRPGERTWRLPAHSPRSASPFPPSLFRPASGIEPGTRRLPLSAESLYLFAPRVDVPLGTTSRLRSTCTAKPRRTSPTTSSYAKGRYPRNISSCVAPFSHPGLLLPASANEQDHRDRVGSQEQPPVQPVPEEAPPLDAAKVQVRPLSAQGHARPGPGR